MSHWRTVNILDLAWGGGVYALYRDGRLIYIGKTQHFKSRLQDHVSKGRFGFDRIKVVDVADAYMRMQRERRLIHRLRPVENKSIPGQFWRQ